MKNKLITLIVFLVALVTCFACSSEKEVIENTDNKQNLQILKTDFKLTQEQTLSKIKAEYLLENNGYKDDDEIIIMVTLNAKPLIEIYNEQYSGSVKNVAEYAKSKDGLVQASIIKNEQDKLIINLLENKLIDSVKYRYNTIINAVAVSTTYGNFKKISELTNVKLDVKVDDGYVYLKCDKDNEFQKILKVILIQLKSVEESYSKYIKIKSNHL